MQYVEDSSCPLKCIETTNQALVMITAIILPFKKISHYSGLHLTEDI